MIFCVEDDQSIRMLMLYTLNASGFKAMGFENGKELFNELKNTLPELIMLDIMLPDMDGLSILKALRENPKTANIPVILATAKGTEYDKVIGLDLGADDYLAKPFGMMEMVSRIRAVLRRCNKTKENSGEKIVFGEITVFDAEHTVFVNDKKIELTLKEYELLLLFIKNKGITFNRDSLLLKVWGEHFAGETRTVDVHIGTLRQKLGVCKDYIQTVRGVGYRSQITKE